MKKQNRGGENKVTTKKLTNIKTRKTIKNLSKKNIGRGQKGQRKGGILPDPFKGDFQKLSLEEKLAAYQYLRKRVNAQAAAQTKKGMSDFLPAIRKMIEAGDIMPSGVAGYRSKFNMTMLTRKKNPMSRSEFLKELETEYKKIYSTYTSKSLYKTKSQLSEELAKKGIDEELLNDMAKNLPAIQKKLNSYYELLHELEKAGLKEGFTLTSDDVQEVAIQYHAKHYSDNLDYAKIVKTVKEDYEKLVANAKPEVTQDEQFYRHYFEDYNEDIIDEVDSSYAKLDEFTKELAKMLAKKHYGTKPVAPAFEDGEGDFARARRRFFGRRK